MLKFFKECKNLEDVKKTYRQLCFKYHPDIFKGDNGETMKAINNEYEVAFKMFKGIHADENADDETQNNAETPEMFKDIVNGLIHCYGVQIDIVGSWVWLTGNTFEHKDIIKNLGFKWASRKKAWYWHSENDGCHSHSKMTLDEIKNKYGCQTVCGKKPLQLV